MLEAICLAEQFSRQDDGSYVCGEFSSGLWIRCIARRDRSFSIEVGLPFFSHRSRSRRSDLRIAFRTPPTPPKESRRFARSDLPMVLGSLHQRVAAVQLVQGRALLPCPPA